MCRVVTGIAVWQAYYEAPLKRRGTLDQQLETVAEYVAFPGYSGRVKEQDA